MFKELRYSLALLLSTAKRKTFEALGRNMEVSGDTMGRIVTRSVVTIEGLIDLAKTVFGNKQLYLLADDTQILKIFSRYIEGTCDHYDSSDRKRKRSICSITAMLTDGETAIPIHQLIWTSQEFKQDGEHKKKWELAQELIREVEKHIPINMVIMDGLYATNNMIEWLTENNIRFEMRFHSNRVIEKNGIKSQIRYSPFFKLSGRRTEQTFRASWKGIDLYFTAIRRLGPKGFFVTFQVSNYKASAKKHKIIYGYRWNIEKFFRTAKQSLGLNDCQSLKLNKQENHIKQVFFAYSIAQIERVDKKLKNVESAIRTIKLQDSITPKLSFHRFREIFRCV
jgi:hypothetical protein